MLLVYWGATAIVLALLLIATAALLVKNKKTQALYENQLTTLSTMFNALPDMVLCKDVNYRYTSYNHHYGSFLGANETDMVGKTAEEVGRLPARIARSLLATDQKVIHEKQTVKDREWIEYPDGTEKYVELIKSPLIRDGKVTGLIGIFRDITDLKMAMDEIDRQNELLETANKVSAFLLDPDIRRFENSLFEALGLLAKALDVDRVYIWKNFYEDSVRFSVQIYQWTSESGQQLDVESAAHAPFSEAWSKFLSEGRCVSGITSNMSPEQREQLNARGVKSLIGVPIFVHEDYWGFVSFDDCRRERFFTETEELIIRSAGRMIANAVMRYEMTHEIIAKSAQLEEAIELAEESSRAKSDFLARMSHEIRTPMNAVIGMTELALREDMPNSAREHIVTVKHAGANLLSIINDILDFSKIESGGVIIARRNYSLSSLINDVISIIRMRAVDSHIRFAVNIDSTLPNALIGDDSRIRQILINILGNAVKYTDKGYVSFSVSGDIVDEKTVVLKMVVEDSGRGIKAEDIENIFNEYVQVQVRSRDVEGVGLGLPISYYLAKSMAGEITVESEYGKGSTFTVFLPQEIHRPEKLAAVDKAEQINTLIFERREIYADSTVYALNSLGVKYELVSNDAELFDKLDNSIYSFIFMAHVLFENHKEKILRSSNNSVIVLMTEFGHAVPDGMWNVISMPIHAISVANLFNGASESFAYNTSAELTARFIAPDARVLVVDDITTNLRVASGLLTPYKMQVDLCSSGADAIEAVKNSDYDLVLMDHRMPDMGGIEATRIIRAMGIDDLYLNELPIVALTANAVSGTKEMFLESGFNDFMTKPVDTVRLNEILEQWLPRQKQVRVVEDKRSAAAAKEQLSRELIKIEGLDTYKGALLSGGKMEMYLETLAVFHNDGSERLQKLRQSSKADDLSLYIVYVHALKSALANIGADKLSDTARTLEEAASRGDSAYIEVNNEAFVAELEVLLVNIDAALPSLEKREQTEPDNQNKEQYYVVLNRLKKALEDMNAGVMNRSVDELLQLAWDDKTKAAVRDISKNILLGEYDEVEKFIDSLLE